MTEEALSGTEKEPGDSEAKEDDGDDDEDTEAQLLGIDPTHPLAWDTLRAHHLDFLCRHPHYPHPLTRKREWCVTLLGCTQLASQDAALRNICEPA